MRNKFPATERFITAAGSTIDLTSPSAGSIAVIDWISCDVQNAGTGGLLEVRIFTSAGLWRQSKTLIANEVYYQSQIFPTGFPLWTNSNNDEVADATPQVLVTFPAAANVITTVGYHLERQSDRRYGSMLDIN